MQILRTKILGFTLLLGGLALCGTGLWLLLSPAQYQATAIIKVDMEEIGGDINMIDGRVLTPGYDPYFVPTSFEVIQSCFVLSNVVSALNLNVEWGKRYGDGNPLETANSIRRLQRRIKLEPIRNTMLLNISFSSDDPNEAARIANAIARAYSDYRVDRWRQLTRGGIQTLTEQYQKEEQELATQRETFDRLRRNVIVVGDPVGMEEKFPAYFEAKRKLKAMEDFHKLLAAKIEAEKLVIADTPVLFIEVAEPPKLPVSPNRWLGATLLAIGLFPAVGGFLLLKSSRVNPTDTSG